MDLFVFDIYNLRSKIFFDPLGLVQPGPDSIGIVAISHGCPGVAARACGLVGLEPTRVSFQITVNFI